MVKAQLRWVMVEWLDDTDHGEHIPPHMCEFITNPEKGACSFHEQWFDAASACGLMDEWADADAELKAGS